MRATRWLAALPLLVAAACHGTGEDAVVLGRNGDLPGSISRAVTEGGPNPAAIPLTLTNGGTCTLAYSIATATADGSAWLSVTPSSGTLGAGLSQGLSININLIPPALRPGTYP